MARFSFLGELLRQMQAHQSLLKGTMAGQCCIENVKGTLRSKLFPALEEVLGCHLCGLKKLVEHHRQFHCNVLKNSTVSVHTQTN